MYGLQRKLGFSGILKAQKTCKEGRRTERYQRGSTSNHWEFSRRDPLVAYVSRWMFRGHMSAVDVINSIMLLQNGIL
jgi:hypothetical protein